MATIAKPRAAEAVGKRWRFSQAKLPTTNRTNPLTSERLDVAPDSLDITMGSPIPPQAARNMACTVIARFTHNDRLSTNIVLAERVARAGNKGRM